MSDVHGAGVQPGAPAHWIDSDLDALVLEMLLEVEDEFIGGAALCDKLDVPRSELLRRIDSLRSRGFVIQASGGRGYRLAGLPDAVSESQLAPLLGTSEIGRHLLVLAETTSTNDEAHRRAEDGAPHGEVIVAERQVGGRGRRGRTWIAPEGKSLALSVILRPALPAARAPELTLVAAVAVCEAVRALGASEARIKWPNDVECGGRKLAGLLLELRADGERIRHAILGLGLNVSAQPQDFPEELRGRATSLLMEIDRRRAQDDARWVLGSDRRIGPAGGGVDAPPALAVGSGPAPERWLPPARSLLLARVLDHLEEWLELHEVEGFEPVRQRWRALSSTLGRDVRVEGESNGLLEGKAEDLDVDGALLIRSRDGRPHRVVAGDVEHCTVL